MERARLRRLAAVVHPELDHGDVSLAYVGKLMHRRYPDTAMFKKVLQSIWHQVNNGQEIYVVGKQWMWKFQHLDGQREINELHVPVGRTVSLKMGAYDVVHSFWPLIT